MFHIQLNAQGKKLEDLSFLELEKKIDSLNSSNQNALPLIKYYIKKSKKENSRVMPDERHRFIPGKYFFLQQRKNKPR